MRVVSILPLFLTAVACRLFKAHYVVPKFPIRNFNPVTFGQQYQRWYVPRMWGYFTTLIATNARLRNASLAPNFILAIPFLLKLFYYRINHLSSIRVITYASQTKYFKLGVDIPMLV